MEGAADEIFPPQERPRAGGLQGDTTRTRPFPQSSSYNSFSTGDQFNAPGGTQNISNGSGNQFPGATFQQPVYFNTKEHFNPLRDCLRSLAFPEMDSRIHDIDTAAQGTCEWLLRHEMYTSWASCDRALLWIKGKPGSGKSTLLQYALKNTMKKTNTGERALILSFFFHGRGTELQRTPLGLFQSLLHQLLRQVPGALPDVVATFQERCETVGKPGEKWQWHPRELPRLFESSLPKVLETHPVWLLVDALDECGEDSAVELVDVFQSLIQTLPTIGLKHFHVCFTCRHYPILVVDYALQICAEDENEKDISTFVQYKLSSFSSTIPALITSRAQGVFLWAWLVVKQVLNLKRSGVGLKKMEAEIRSVPQKLDTLYRQLIQSMSPDSLKLIQWICFATRPLALDELRWALLVDANCSHRSLYECQTAGDYPSDHDGMKRRVQTLSCGLAEVTSDTKIAQFIHQSVKDFFVEKGLSALDKSAKADLVVRIAHHRLSRTCIRYLAMEEIGQLAIRTSDHLRSEFRFLHYATTSWVAHTKQSDARSVPQEDLLEYFTWPSNTLVERWVRVYGILERYSDDCPPERTSLVHVMSRYGVTGALWAILERADQVGINIDAKDSHGRTPLARAAENGHEAVVRLLLDRGAHTEAADEKGQTPLLWAAANGDEAVVRLLLDRGAHTEVADEKGQTPLLWAAANGDEAVVRLLLDGGAHTEAVDKKGRTPLARAAGEGHEAVPLTFLERARSVVKKAVGKVMHPLVSELGANWVSRAAAGGYEAVVRLLLERGAGTEAADEKGQTPLSVAAAKGHEAVVRLLLDGGAHTEAADNRGGRTPLSVAALNGDEAVVRLLLERGAHTEAADKEGQTPLLWAAAKGHEAVVRLLLECGAHTEAADKILGRTPLLWAAENGHEAVVRLLLERGAHIEAADQIEGRTPLLWAAANGHKAVVRLLLECGAHTEAADKILGRTPLLWAAENGHDAVVRLLLSGGADIEAADKWSRTPLSRPAANGHEAVVRLLLSGGADIEAADKKGWTPLRYAAANGHEAVVRLLLERDANTEAADVEGRTPLSKAAAKGHEAVARLLLDGGADTEAADKEGWTPLWWAAKNGHVAVVRLLQDHIAQSLPTTLI